MTSAPEDKIEVTPEMIKAGVQAIAECHYPHADPDPWEEIALQVYVAMTKAKPFFLFGL